MNKLKAIYTKYKNHICILINSLFLISIIFQIHDYLVYEIIPSNIDLIFYIMLIIMIPIFFIIILLLDIIKVKIDIKQETLEEENDRLLNQIERMSAKMDELNKVEYKELKTAEEIIEFMNKVKP